MKRRSDAIYLTEMGAFIARRINDRIGSRLYLLKRRKLTNKTPQHAREYMQQALAWMTDDGVAARIDVTSERTGTDTLAAGVTIYQRDGVIHNITFDDIWSELNG